MRCADSLFSRLDGYSGQSGQIQNAQNPACMIKKEPSNLRRTPFFAHQSLPLDSLHSASCNWKQTRLTLFPPLRNEQIPRLFCPPIHFVSINMPYLFRASQPSSLSFPSRTWRFTPRQSSSRNTLGSTRKIRSPLSSSQTYPAGLEGAYPSCQQESILQKRVSACFWKKVLIRSGVFSTSLSPIPPRS